MSFIEGSVARRFFLYAGLVFIICLFSYNAHLVTDNKYYIYKGDNAIEIIDGMYFSSHLKQLYTDRLFFNVKPSGNQIVFSSLLRIAGFMGISMPAPHLIYICALFFLSGALILAHLFVSKYAHPACGLICLGLIAANKTLFWFGTNAFNEPYAIFLVMAALLMFTERAGRFGFLWPLALILASSLFRNEYFVLGWGFAAVLLIERRYVWGVIYFLVSPLYYFAKAFAQAYFTPDKMSYINWKSYDVYSVDSVTLAIKNAVFHLLKVLDFTGNGDSYWFGAIAVVVACFGFFVRKRWPPLPLLFLFCSAFLVLFATYVLQITPLLIRYNYILLFLTPMLVSIGGWLSAGFVFDVLGRSPRGRLTCQVLGGCLCFVVMVVLIVVPIKRNHDFRTREYPAGIAQGREFSATLPEGSKVFISYLTGWERLLRLDSILATGSDKNVLVRAGFGADARSDEPYKKFHKALFKLSPDYLVLPSEKYRSRYDHEYFIIRGIGSIADYVVGDGGEFVFKSPYSSRPLRLRLLLSNDIIAAYKVLK